ncbi:MAG TPA: cupin domain-containing protein [Firmicutes bacterium]|nr:cupin domain-containing protein [Bacillota bacterium]
MPRIVNCTSIKGVVTEESGSKGLVYRQVLDKKDGYTYGVTCNDVMPGGNTKDHLHLGIHITYVLKGLGELRVSDTEVLPIKAGDLVYIGPNERHCFYNTGDEIMVLIGLQE